MYQDFKDLLSAFHAQIGLDEYVHVLGRPGELRHRRAKPEAQLICGVCFEDAREIVLMPPEP